MHGAPCLPDSVPRTLRPPHSLPPHSLPPSSLTGSVLPHLFTCLAHSLPPSSLLPRGMYEYSAKLYPAQYAGASAGGMQLYFGLWALLTLSECPAPFGSMSLMVQPLPQPSVSLKIPALAVPRTLLRTHE